MLAKNGGLVFYIHCSYDCAIYMLSINRPFMQGSWTKRGTVWLGLFPKWDEFSKSRWFCVGSPGIVRKNMFPKASELIHNFNILSSWFLIDPRTALYMVLCLMPCGLLLCGPDCSSWTLISRGTSWRTPMNPWGNMCLNWVRNANLMISRFLTRK